MICLWKLIPGRLKVARKNVLEISKKKFCWGTQVNFAEGAYYRPGHAAKIKENYCYQESELFLDWCVTNKLDAKLCSIDSGNDRASLKGNCVPVTDDLQTRLQLCKDGLADSGLIATLYLALDTFFLTDASILNIMGYILM
jgi:hypothetical protein